MQMSSILKFYFIIDSLMGSVSVSKAVVDMIVVPVRIITGEIQQCNVVVSYRSS